MREAEEIRRDLFRLSAAVEQALGSLGVAASKAQEALALLEEARSWLGVGPRLKRVKPPRFHYRWPENILFWALSGLDAGLKKFKKLTRSSKAKAEFLRAEELTKTARGFLYEAWLEFLRAYGLPHHFKPLRSLPMFGGFISMLLLWTAYTFALSFLQKKQNSFWISMLLGAWMVFASYAFRLVVFPRRPRNAPLFLRKGTLLWHVAIGMAVLLFLAGLGVLLFPKWAKLIGAFGLAGFVVAVQYFFPALRIALMPEEVRVLLLPQYYVIFGPATSSLGEKKVFRPEAFF